MNLKSLKRSLLFLAAIFLSTQALAYSGAGSIWYQPKGAFIPINAPGDTTGFGIARDRCIARGGGVIQVGPGLEGLTFTYPPGAGLLVLQSTIYGWSADPFLNIIAASTDSMSGLFWQGGQLSPFVVNRARLQSYLDRATATKPITIWLSTGTVGCDSTVWIHGNTSIIGAGMGLTAIKRTRFSESDPAFAGDVVLTAKYGTHSINNTFTGGVPSDSLENITLAQLTVDGNSQAWPTLNPNSPRNFGIHLFYTDGISLSHVEVKNTLQTGIEFCGCRDTDISNCRTKLTGQETMLGTRNGINYNDNSGSLSILTNWNRRHNLNNVVIENQNDTGIDLLGASQVNINNLTITCTHNGTLAGNTAIELEGNVSGYVSEKVNITNVTATGLTGSFLANNLQAGTALRDYVIDHVSCTFSTIAHNSYPIRITNNSSNSVNNFKLMNGVFRNINTNLVASGNTFVGLVAGQPQVSSNITLFNLEFYGSNGGTDTANRGIEISGNFFDVNISKIFMSGVEDAGVYIHTGAANFTLRKILVEDVYIDGARQAGFVAGIESSTGKIEDIEFRNCIAKDTNLDNADNSFIFSTGTAGAVMKAARMNGCKIIRTSGTFMRGAALKHTASSTMDSIFIGTNEFAAASNTPWTITGTPTNVFWADNAQTNTIARLGPFSTPTTGGAIRYVEGTTFALTSVGVQAALDDLPSGGGTVILPATTITSTAPIKIANGKALIGTPRATRIVAQAGFSGTAMIMNSDTTGASQSAIIQGIELDGTKASATVARGILLKGIGQPSVIRDVVVTSCTGTGIWLEGVSSHAGAIPSLDNVWVNNCNDHNIRLKGPWGAFTANRVSTENIASGKAGFYMDGTSGATIEGGAWLRDFHVENMASGSQGILIEDSKDVTVDGVLYFGSGGNGDLVKITGTTTDTYNIILRNLYMRFGAAATTLNDAQNTITYTTEVPYYQLGNTDVRRGRGVFGDSIRVEKGLYVGGQFVNKILRASATLDFDLSAATTHDLTVTVTGAAVGDEVFIGVPNGSITANTLFYGWVSAANTVTVRAMQTVGNPNPASGTFKVTVLQ